MSDVDPDPVSAALPAALLNALVEQGSDLVVVTTVPGQIVWANTRFRTAFGSGRAGSERKGLIDFAPPGLAGEAARSAVLAGLAEGALATRTIELEDAQGARLSLQVRASRLGDRVLWTLTDVSMARRLADEARRQRELLDSAQEFGRLGLWERRIPSGEGHWDAHVFRYWGLDPGHGTPTFEQAIERIHPDDRARMTYRESTQRAGRYAQHYRVIQPDGKVRWLHSQWEVKNGPDGTPDRAVGVMMDDTEVYDEAKKLGDVHAQLKLAVDLGDIAIWRHDLRTQRMHYSDRAFHVLGMEAAPDGVPIEVVRTHIHPDDLGIVLASAEESLRSDQPTDSVARYRGADGDWHHVLTRRVVERDATGVPLAFLGVSLDMTDRVKHLRHADELARRLEAASRAAGIGLWTISIDPPDTDWNAQMFVLFDRFQGPRVPSFGEWLREAVHGEDRDRVAGVMQSYLTNGEGPSEIEFRALRRDGSVRWIVMRADRDRSANERPGRILGIAIDVTEHHAAIEALRHASARSLLITRHAGIGTWETGPDGTAEVWDEQMFRLRGLAPREQALTRGERLALVHPDDQPNVLDSFAGTPAAELPSAYEFRVRLPDGRYRWLASRSAAVLDEDGRTLRRVGVNWDVNEAKEAELARQQAALAEREVRAKSQFLSRMSHELRTPLNAVLGFTQLLQIEARRSGEAVQLAKLGHIRDAGDHLLSLINDVLDLSGLESGELKLHLQTIDLGALVRQSVPMLESLAAQHGVEVVVDVGSLTSTVQADPTRLRQVLINLLSNAIKYNRRGGRVLVQSRVEGDRAVLSVRDSGRGLDAAQLVTLFEPFNRFGAESEGIEGTGIGLTIVKALVDGMGATIAVDSTLGAGTVFEVGLARASDQPEAASIGEIAAAAPAATGRLLYIEDNPVNVLLVEELVKSIGGIAITSETTGAAGVARARAMRPDLVLIDLQLPDFDGFEVLRRLRADPLTRAIPCVALSANAMPEDIERGLAAGFSDYWAKPIDFGVFIGALNRLLSAATASDREPAAVDAAR